MAHHGALASIWRFNIKMHSDGHFIPELFLGFRRSYDNGEHVKFIAIDISKFLPNHNIHKRSLSEEVDDISKKLNENENIDKIQIEEYPQPEGNSGENPHSPVSEDDVEEYEKPVLISAPIPPETEKDLNKMSHEEDEIEESDEHQETTLHSEEKFEDNIVSSTQAQFLIEETKLPEITKIETENQSNESEEHESNISEEETEEETPETINLLVTIVYHGENDYVCKVSN